MRVFAYTPPLYGIASSGFSPALRDVCRTIPGMRAAYEGEKNFKGWVGYPDAVASAVRALEVKGIRVNASALPSPDAWRSYEPPFPVSWMCSRDYQIEAIRFLIAQGPFGALLADEMGIGKGHSATRAARAFKEKTLIVCPSHVRGVWSRFDPKFKKTTPQTLADQTLHPGELQKWWPKVGIVCLPEGVNAYTPLIKPRDNGAEGSQYFRPKARSGRHPSIDMAAMAVVIHFDILYAWVDALIAWGFRTLIVDECQAAQSAKTRRSVALARLAEHASVRIGLSGTPMANRPADLWNILNILSPGRMGGFFNYGLAFCNGHKEEVAKDKVVWDFKGASQTEELAKRLQYCMLRRTKREVALQLPPKTRVVIDVDVQAKHRTAVTSTIAGSKRAMRECLNLAANGKLPSALDIIQGHAEADHRVVAFTIRRSIAEYVANAMALRGTPSAVITGKVSERNRERIVRGASELPSHVLAATIDSTGTGIDLTYADVAVFIELSWEPWKLAQAEARLDRSGQRRPVLIQYIVARGTGDEIVMSVVLSKLDTIEAAVGGLGDGMKEELDTAPKGKDALNMLYEAIVKQEQAARDAEAKAKRKRK